MNKLLKEIGKFSLFSGLVIFLAHDTIIAQSQTINQWIKLESEGMYSAYARTLVIDPQNPNTIYVGLKGGGIYRSYNGVEYWEEINDGIKNKDILSLVINPADTNIIYAGTEEGIFKSTDGGDHWHELSFPKCHVNSIAVHPTKPETLFAATGKLYGKGETIKGLWYSTDAGNNWKHLILKDYEIPVEVYTVYTFKDSLSGQTKTYVGTSNGIWTDTTDSFTFDSKTHDNSLRSERVFCFELNPNDTKYIYAGTQRGLRLGRTDRCEWLYEDSTLINKRVISLSTDETFLYAGTNGQGLYKTELFKDINDANWEKITTGNIKIVYSIYIDLKNPLGKYLASPKGIFKKEEDGQFHNKITGINCAQINEFVIDPHNANIFYAATQNGGFKSINRGKSWIKIDTLSVNEQTNLPNEEIITFAIDPRDNNIVYSIVQSDGIYESKDQGENWEKITIGEKKIFSILITYENNFKPIFFGSDIRIYKLLDNEIFLKDANYPVTVLIADSNYTNIYAGTQGNGILKSSNYGDSWDYINKGGLHFANINALVIDRKNSNLLFCGTNQGIFKSIDAGTSWIQLDDPHIKNFKINTLCFHPSNDKILLAGTDQGSVFISRDKGETWKDLDKNLDNYNILNLKGLVINDTTTFYAGTEGNSIYYYKLCDPEIEVSPDTLLFEDTMINDSSKIFMTIKNEGKADLEIIDIISSNKVFKVNPFERKISPDSSKKIKVSFIPDYTISYEDCLTVFSNDLQTPQKKVNLKGKGIAPILVSLTEHDFGKVKVNDSTTWQCSISDSGNAELIINEISVINAQIFKFEPDSFTIAPLSSDTLKITFTPTEPIVYRDKLSLKSNDPENLYFEIFLEGEGVISKDNIPPNIEYHQTVFYTLKGEAIQVYAEISDNLSGLAWKKLYFRMGGSKQFLPVPFNETKAAIPSEYVTMRGVEYFIAAEDRAGNRSQVPDSPNYFSISITSDNEFASDSSGNPIQFVGGDQQNAYRMFSIPLILDNPDPKSILVDDLGENTCGQNWRLVEYISKENIIDYPNTSIFKPGKGFWLIIRESGKTIDTGSGRSLFTSELSRLNAPDTTNYARIPLVTREWNIIGNPFNFPIPKSNLSLTSNEPITNFLTWEGKWDTLKESTSIEPWKGYAIKPNNETELIFNPCLANPPSRNSLWKVAKFSSDQTWKIQICANCGSAQDNYSYLGVNPNASMEWDIYDRYEPPSVGNYVMVYFPHEDWSLNPDVYAADIQPCSDEGNIWDFEAQTNISNSEVMLTFRGINNVPELFDMCLIDKNLEIIRNLRADICYSYFSISGDTPKKLRLIVGKQNFIEDNNFGIKAIPKTFELFQNFPNPFNQATIIRYALPEEEAVTLAIFNILGERVKSLVNNESQNAGYHLVVWDGTNDNSMRVGAGIYFCILKTKIEIKQKKILLIK